MSHPPKGQFKILYFAAASSFTGQKSESFPAPLPLAKLFNALEERYQGIKSEVLNHSLVTINLDYVDVPADEGTDTNGLVIQEGDEVTIIPPVSSG